jgi:hypothetical protein
VHQASGGATVTMLGELAEPAGDGSPELVVDVANVCRNRTLGHSGDAARWDRLLAVLDAWNRWEYGFSRPVVRLVADTSLRSVLSSDDARELRRAEADGFAQVLDYADPVILDLAEAYDCSVLTNDQFVGHRRERPWLDGNDDRFVQFEGRDGDVVLWLAQLTKRTSYSVSRAEETDELKARRIDLARQRGTHLLSAVYRCDNPACLRRALAPDGAMPPPAHGPGGEAVCTTCEQALTRVGDLRDTAVIKLVSSSGGEPVRLPLTAGGSVLIGRVSDDLSLKALLAPAELRKISREHASIAFDGRAVVITDHGSTNGTEYERWDRTVKSRSEGRRLAPQASQEVGPRDRAVLGGVLALERSGRRFPFDLAKPATAPPPVAGPTILAKEP